MNQQPNKLEQYRKPTDRAPISAHQRTRTKVNEPESGRNAPARSHLDAEGEKRAAKASGKRIQRGQGRITHPKTNQSNQYR